MRLDDYRGIFMNTHDQKLLDLPALITSVSPALDKLPPMMIYRRSPDGLVQKDVWPEGESCFKNREEPLHKDALNKNRLGPGFCINGCCFGGLTEGGEMLAFNLAEARQEKNDQLIHLLWRALAFDLGQQKKMAAYQDEAEFGNSVVQSMSSGFMVLRPDLKVINANKAACELLRTDKEKLIGAKLTDIILSKLAVKQVFATGKAILDQEVFIKLADRDIHILKTAVPVFGKNGQVIAVLDHFREIKEAHQLVSRMTGARASFTFADIIHQSQIMAEAIELSRMAAGNSLSVFITGESGTGKELFAHAIHVASSRRNAPFVVIDCASMPRDLVASELFGYMEGAFTGTRKGGMPGKFELADGGTVFLDELGELPMEVQAQFLRVLQNRQVRRLGGKEMLPVDIRVIAATNRDLAVEVKRGNFREDLYYRLNVLAINVPPLRNRKDDVARLADFFLNKYSQITGKRSLAFSDGALELLMSHNWPGNVRELENAVARAVHICHSVIEPQHLSFPRRHDQLNAEKPADGHQVELEAGEGPQLPSMRVIEEKVYREAISACGGNISKAAKKLGVARSTIYKKMALWN